MNNVFMATPISGFAIQEDYLKFRENALRLIAFLRAAGYKVCSELERVDTTDSYDSPAKSAEDDFDSIKENEYFLLLHPERMQTSSLIEFGYACALDKKIVIVGDRSKLPYLAIGYEEYSSKATIVEAEDLCDGVFPKISEALRSV